jgi:hypothetical protein
MAQVIELLLGKLKALVQTSVSTKTMVKKKKKESLVKIPRKGPRTLDFSR